MSFLYPYVLLALALPLLLAVGIVVARRRAGAAWRRLVSPAHPELVRRLPAWRVAAPVALALLALVGIIVAAARPINGYGQGEGTASGRNLLIALDISRSMETQDVAPSRLDEARAAAYELIDALPGDKIGLIVFSGEADVVVPLTYDHTALRDALEQVNRDWAGYGGTNFGLLLRAAMQNFTRSAPEGANALVILSDGEDTVDSSLEIAEEARKSKLLVITVGIGTPAGGAIPDPQGENGLWQDASGRHVISKLDVAALRRFAEATGGDYFTMNSGADLAAFARQAAEKLDRHEETYDAGREPLDLFAWFALPSLLALLAAIIIGSEWRAPRHTALLLVLLWALPVAQAATEPESYSQAIQALGKGELDAAREQFSAALLSENPALQAAAHLALGNMRSRSTFDKLRSLYEGGEEASAPKLSIEALQGIVDELREDMIPYRDALAADDRLSAAQQNIAKLEALIKRIEEEIERMKQQQNQDNQQNQDQQQNQDNQQNQDQQQNQDNQQNQDQQGQDDKQNQDQQQGQDDQQNQDRQQGQDDQQNQDQQQGQDDKQNQDRQQNQDDKQNQDQQQGQDDKQNQDQQQGQDDKQNQDQQQGQDDKQNQDQQQGQDNKQNQDPQQGQEQNQEPQQPQNAQGDARGQEAQAQQAEEAELTEDQKNKQRAAGVLRMHLDEEKGSPIPHFNKAVRPPSKDY